MRHFYEIKIFDLNAFSNAQRIIIETYIKEEQELINCLLSIITNSDIEAFKHWLQSHYGIEVRRVSDNRYVYCVKDMKDLPSAIETMYLTLSKVKIDDEPEST